jgi:hypothetical protein
MIAARSLRRAALLGLLCVLPALAAAQVAPPSLRHLSEMPGFVMLAQLIGAHAVPRDKKAQPPAAQPPADAAQQPLAFARSAALHAQAMGQAAQLLAKSGVSVEMAGRLTNSGYFSNAARRYAETLQLRNVQGDLGQALAAYLAVCWSSHSNEPATPAKAAGLNLLAASRLRLALAQAATAPGDAERQQMADALNTQTGMAALIIEQRKASHVSNKELAIYCVEGARKLGFELDQLKLRHLS